MPKFRVTYEIVTEESASNGEAAESGFIVPGGWQIPIALALTDPDPHAHDMSLKDALNLCNPQEDCGRWFTEVDPRIDYRSGENETRSLHPPDGITAASYRRLAMALGVRR